MSRIASSSEATFMTPTAGPNDCISSEGAGRDTPGKRIARMIQAAARSVEIPVAAPQRATPLHLSTPLQRADRLRFAKGPPALPLRSLPGEFLRNTAAGFFPTPSPACADSAWLS